MVVYDVPILWKRLLMTVVPSAVIPICLAIIGHRLYSDLSWVHEPFHTFVEVVGSFSALLLSVFIIIMRNNRQLHPKYIWVAATLTGMGLLDGFHATLHPGNIFVWFHSLATFFGGVIFALVVLPEKIFTYSWLRHAPYFVAVSSVVIGLVSVVDTSWVPSMIIEGRFTAQASLLNILGGTGFFLAWFHFAWLAGEETQENEQVLLANHCLLFGMAGMLFEFSVIWDGTWWLWHFLRLFAYLILLSFFVGLYRQYMQQAMASHENERKKNLILEESNRELQETESALRESETRFSLAMQGINDGLWDWNLKTGDVYYSPRWKGMLGYSDEEIRNHLDEWISNLHPDDSERAYKATEEYLSGKLSRYEVEFRMRHKNGHYVPILCRGSAFLDESWKPIRFVGTHIDITERKCAEENLLEAKLAAEIANQAKSEFLATISHEIRTPLNGIMGMTELLMEKRLSSKKQFYVEMIQKSGESLLRVINDVLDFSKIEAGEIILDEVVIDLRETRQEFRDLFGELAKKKGLSFHTSIESNVPKYVKGDRHRIHQVLINLFSNAMKFTKSGEIIFRIESEESDGNALVSFIVEDTGIGISEAALDYLFQPFTQADTSTTRQYGGTGLGLTICKKLTDLMNGTISVESEEGRGSRFVVELPMEIPETIPEPPVETIKQSKVTFSKETSVLVVEDNIVNQRLFQIVLKNMGIKVKVTNHGLEALEALEKEKFDLVLMDCHMPVMDGMEAVKIYRKSEEKNKLSRTPFVAVTANVMQGEEEICLQAGFDKFVTKPVDKQKLQSVIQQFVGTDKIIITE